MKRLFISILVFAALLCTSAFAEDIAVRVGDYSYTAEEVQAYIDRAAQNIEQSFGMPLREIYAPGTEEEFLTDAAEHFVTIGIINTKLDELGIERISAEEAQELRRYAQTAYEQLWQETFDSVKEAYPNLEDTDLLVTETMESAGYTMNEIYAQGEMSLSRQKLIERYCADVSVSKEEAREYYEDNYVEPDREKYESDVPLFEQEVLLTEGSSCYVPEGYYYIKYIVLRPDAETLDKIYAASEKLEESESESEDLQKQLADALIKDEVPGILRQRYQAAQDAQAQALAELEEGIRAAEEAYAPMGTLIRTEMEAGTSFEELIRKHSILNEMGSTDDTGFPFHKDSQIWDERLREEILKLEKYGDCTPPVFVQSCVYIVCRMDDMRGGAYEPTEQLMQSLREEMEYEKQQSRLEELTQEWRKGMSVTVDLSTLKYPGE